MLKSMAKAALSHAKPIKPLNYRRVIEKPEIGAISSIPMLLPLNLHKQLTQVLHLGITALQREIDVGSLISMAITTTLGTGVFLIGTTLLIENLIAVQCLILFFAMRD